MIDAGCTEKSLHFRTDKLANTMWAPVEMDATDYLQQRVLWAGAMVHWKRHPSIWNRKARHVGSLSIYVFWPLCLCHLKASFRFFQIQLHSHWGKAAYKQAGNEGQVFLVSIPGILIYKRQDHTSPIQRPNSRACAHLSRRTTAQKLDAVCRYTKVEARQRDLWDSMCPSTTADWPQVFLTLACPYVVSWLEITQLQVFPH